jgi:hypothetical protein
MDEAIDTVDESVRLYLNCGPDAGRGLAAALNSLGSHLPISTDTILATEFSRRVVDRWVRGAQGTDLAGAHACLCGRGGSGIRCPR